MNNEWGTPPELVRELEAHLNLSFKSDLAASADNHKCTHYLTEEMNTLSVDWAALSWTVGGAMWLNPPYSRGLISPFMEKAAKACQLGAEIVALVRFDPSAKWFQRYVDRKASRVLMLPKRVKFVGAPAAYNFPVCAAHYSRPTNPVMYPSVTEYYIPNLDWSQ